MYGFKIFIFLLVLVGAIFCLYALSTDKIKVLVNDRPLLETAIAMMCAMIASPLMGKNLIHIRLVLLRTPVVRCIRLLRKSLLWRISLQSILFLMNLFQPAYILLRI